MTVRAASLKLIKVQTVLMKCVINLRVSFAQNNTESEFHSNKTNTYCKNKWEEKKLWSIKLHFPVHNISVIGRSYAQTSTF